MPYLTPQSIPEETTCRPLLIPDDTAWFGIVSGALTELLKLHNWEQSPGGITREQAVERVWTMLLDHWQNSCEGGGAVTRIYRLGIRGQLQFSLDVGETWTDAEDTIIEPLPPRLEPTEDDKKCAAAANAENVLREVYLELLEAFNTDSTINYGIAVFAAILGLLIAAFWLPLAAITALINFALGAFGAAWAGLQFLSGDDWTVQFQDELICLLLNNATVTDGVVAFDYMAVRDNLETLSGETALKFWVFYILQVIGAEGLNAAGATTAVENYDCDCLSCFPYIDFNREECYVLGQAVNYLPTTIDTEFGNPAPSALSGNGTTSGKGMSVQVAVGNLPRPLRRATCQIYYNSNNNTSNALAHSITYVRNDQTLIASTSYPSTGFAMNTWHTMELLYTGEEIGFLRFGGQVVGSTPAPITGKAWIDNIVVELKDE